MRLFSTALLIALFVPLSAIAQPIKKVEVTNDATNPVEVIGEVAVTYLPRFQLVGFTSATYSGAMGGTFGVTQKCQLEFPISRMCSLEEVSLTTTIPTGLVGTARVRGTLSARGVLGYPTLPSRTLWYPFSWPINLYDSCSTWTNDDPVGASTGVGANGNPATIDSCSLMRPIACCALVP